MRNMKNKRGKLITVLFVAAMSVSLFTGCSDDATITGLDEGALPELASDTRAVTDELIESDSISNFSLLAATEYSDAELKKRIRSGWWKQYYEEISTGFYEFKIAYPVPVFFEFVSKKTGEIIDTIIFFPDLKLL